tara:strand:- start:268 stop:519 length:252 start_codon:yes stop_codon:yes gene_type:complete
MRVILDIGSNDGFNSLAFAILNPNIEVFSFEPNPYLKKNYVKKNRVGDHIWYITDNSKFKKDYPNWNQKYNTEKIINELIEIN